MDERFDALDYCVFGGMLTSSALIGVYFAFFAKQKQNSTTEYLLGGKTLGLFPMSMSLIASNISGISLMGLPSEMFTYGTQLWINTPAEVVAYIVTYYLFLPVIFNLQLTSVYEYFRKRFDTRVQKLVSCLFLATTLFYMPIVLYVPALAFAQVTGISINVLIPLVCLVTVFYTTVGGLKAVVWTDTLQTVLILGGVLTVSIIGTIKGGGLSGVWQKSLEGGRIEFFNMDPDITLRHTFWTVFIGRFTYIMSVATVNQSIVQRFLAMPSLTGAKKLIIIMTIGMVILYSFCCYTGLVIYAAFHDCDPVLSRKIKKYDQILPYYILKTASNIPFLPGVFVAGVFSASISTISTCLNSWTGVLFEDFIRPMIKKPISELRASFYMKIIVALTGTLIMVLATAVDKLGGIIQTSYSFSGAISGMMLGIFLLGTLLPWVNSTGALVGGIVSSMLLGWISLGTQFAIARKEITFPKKTFSIEGCDNATLENYYNSILNETTPLVEEVKKEPFFLYKISHLYYSVIGTVVVIVVALLVSWLTGMNKPHKVDKDLLSPVIHKFIAYEEEKEMVNIKLLQGHKDSLDLRALKKPIDDQPTIER